MLVNQKIIREFINFNIYFSFVCIDKTNFVRMWPTYSQISNVNYVYSTWLSVFKNYFMVIIIFLSRMKNIKCHNRWLMTMNDEINRLNAWTKKSCQLNALQSLWNKKIVWLVTKTQQPVCRQILFNSIKHYFSSYSAFLSVQWPNECILSI